VAVSVVWAVPAVSEAAPVVSEVAPVVLEVVPVVLAVAPAVSAVAPAVLAVAPVGALRGEWGVVPQLVGVGSVALVKPGAGVEVVVVPWLVRV